MWDIKICCDKYYRDIFKAYFVVNNFDYIEREDGIVFYANTIDKFFIVIEFFMNIYFKREKTHNKLFILF